MRVGNGLHRAVEPWQRQGQVVAYDCQLAEERQSSPVAVTVARPGRAGTSRVPQASTVGQA